MGPSLLVSCIRFDQISAHASAGDIPVSPTYGKYPSYPQGIPCWYPYRGYWAPCRALSEKNLRGCLWQRIRVCFAGNAIPTFGRESTFTTVQSRTHRLSGVGAWEYQADSSPLRSTSFPRILSEKTRRVAADEEAMTLLGLHQSSPYCEVKGSWRSRRCRLQE